MSERQRPKPPCADGKRHMPERRGWEQNPQRGEFSVRARRAAIISLHCALVMLAICPFAGHLAAWATVGRLGPTCSWRIDLAPAGVAAPYLRVEHRVGD